MAWTLTHIVHSSTVTPIIFFIISRMRNKSLLPIALMAFKFAVWIGKNAYVMQKIRKKGTHGIHLSVSNNRTSGIEHAIKPAIIGMMTNVLVIMERLVMFFTRCGSFWTFDMVGNNTLSIEMPRLLVMSLGNCPPLS